jgi:hypothetical protein
MMRTQAERDRPADAEHAASFEARQENEAMAVRIAGYSATSVEQVLDRVRMEAAIADRRAERHRALEVPHPEPLSQREITQAALRDSRLSGSQPGRAARLGRLHRVLHPGEALDRVRESTFGAWAHFGEADR